MHTSLTLLFSNNNTVFVISWELNLELCKPHRSRNSFVIIKGVLKIWRPTRGKAVRYSSMLSITRLLFFMRENYGASRWTRY